jgi:hypothetical protein
MIFGHLLFMQISPDFAIGRWHFALGSPNQGDKPSRRAATPILKATRPLL